MNILKNQNGGVYIVALIVSSAIGGAYIYVTKHFESKLSIAEDKLALEHVKNMHRELTLALSKPEVCMATLGDDYRIPLQKMKNKYEPPLPPSSEEDASNREIDIVLGLPSDHGPVVTSKPAPKFESYSNLEISDVQLVFPSSPLPSASPQVAQASIFVTVSQWENGRFKKYFPPMEEKALITLKKVGNEYRVEGCVPELPMEMTPDFQAPFPVAKKGDYNDFIKIKAGENEERDAFKLCVISGFQYRPDNNAMSAIPFQKGQIAALSPSSCRVYPVDDNGDERPVTSITSPVRWKMQIKTKDDMELFGELTIQKFYPNSECEAICF